MGGMLKSSSFAGLISAVIWMMISTAVGMDKAPVIVGGLLCLIGTTLITALISSLVSRSRTSST